MRSQCFFEEVGSQPGRNWVADSSTTEQLESLGMKIPRKYIVQFNMQTTFAQSNQNIYIDKQIAKSILIY